MEAARFALDDPLPFLMMALTDCCEFYRWFRCQIATRQPASPKKFLHPHSGLEPSASPEK
jgi:hypothetical protein